MLIDYWSYAKKSYDPFTSHPISLSELLACAKAQQVEFQYGDVLIIRSGWIDTYNNMSDKDREALGTVKNYAHEFVGVEQSEEMVDFLHDNYFSAVAGDTPAFECWPTDKDWNHHGILVPLWGMPIGEMWDLEKLSETCKNHGQYSFFFSSIPTNVMGRLIFRLSAVIVLILLRWCWKLPKRLGDVLMTYRLLTLGLANRGFAFTFHRELDSSIE